jgi:DNA replication licensing factor MCM5
MKLCRDKLRANLLLKQFHLEVDLRHVALYNDDLAHAIQDRPGDVLPIVSSTASRNVSVIA